MIINELEIKDLGRHDLKVSLSVPVVGLLGPNASGKSNILKLLKWLFTGDTGKETQESFVRNWGKEGAATNGWARAVFTINGAQGVIFRQAGKSARRYLEWGQWKGDKKLTKQADVEKVLNEIFGADRRALSEAIFIPQGELAVMFDGGVVEREELFTKLLLLGHMAKVEGIFEGKIKHLSQGLQDMTFALDDLAKQRETAEIELAQLEKQLVQTRDWDPELQALRAHAQSLADANTATTAVDYYTNQKTTAGHRLNALLVEAFLPGVAFASVSELEAGIEGVKQSLDLLRQEYGVLGEHHNFLRTIDQLEEQRRNLSAQRVEATLAWQAASAESVGDLKGLQTQASAIRTWQAANKAQQDAMQAMVDAGAALAAFEKINFPPDAVTMAADEAEIDLLLSQYTELSLKHKARSLIGTATTCPICDSQVDTSKVTPEAVAALAAKMADIQKRGAALRESVKVRRKALEDHSSNRARLIGVSSSAAKQYQQAAQACGPQPSGELVALEAQISKIQTATASAAAAFATQENLAKQIAALAPPADRIAEQTARAAFNEARFRQVAVDIESKSGLLRKMEDRLKNCKPIWQEIIEADRLIVENTRLRAEKSAQAEMQALNFSSELKSFIANPEEGRTTEQSLEAKNQARDETTGKVIQARKRADQVRAQQADMQEKAERDEIKRGYLADLKALRDTFTRSGLPMRFVRYKFERLTELTRINLGKLDANFIVDVDRSQSVSFTFTRIDEPEPYVMPMSKLSGGQRVRLAIAFLMAVQQLVVPEVAFLVLDEPSNHVDLEGRESLKELLINLAPQLGNSHAQIWVCDHAVELEPAFGKIIRLTN